MKTLNAVKLRNSIKRINPDLVVELENVRINGELRGCNGFVANMDTGRVVYVSTDRGIDPDDRVLMRYAADMRDYVGERNRYVTRAGAAQAIVVMLTAE